jgi:hypothetical protein
MTTALEIAKAILGETGYWEDDAEKILAQEVIRQSEAVREAERLLNLCIGTQSDGRAMEIGNWLARWGSKEK